MDEKRYIPGTNPAWGRELPDGDVNSLVDKAGNTYDNGYNFDEKDEENEVPKFDPEEAKKRYEAVKAEQEAEQKSEQKDV